MKKKQIALIPAYEPDEALLDVVRGLKEMGLDIVVVDDGSGEEYADVFAELEAEAGVEAAAGSGTENSITVLHHSKNRGKGAAIKTGLAYIAGASGDCPAWSHWPAAGTRGDCPPWSHWLAAGTKGDCPAWSHWPAAGTRGDCPHWSHYTIVTVDADGQHKAADVMRVLRAAEEDEESLTLGSRRFTGKVPLRSRLGNAVTRAVYRMTSGERVYDTQTGLRAFSDRLVERLLAVDGERYEYEMNVLMEFAREMRPIREVPIETVYLNDNASSHFSTVKDSFRIYREILKFSAASLAGFLTDYALYCLMLAATGSLILANITARITSATVNYSLNRKIVFQSKAPLARSIAQYAALAAAILIANTIVLQTLASLGCNRYLAKVLTEAAFFAVSWAVQRNWVFKIEKAGGV